MRSTKELSENLKYLCLLECEIAADNLKHYSSHELNGMSANREMQIDNAFSRFELEEIYAFQENINWNDLLSEFDFDGDRFHNRLRKECILAQLVYNYFEGFFSEVNYKTGDVNRCGLISQYANKKPDLHEYVKHYACITEKKFNKDAVQSLLKRNIRQVRDAINKCASPEKIKKIAEILDVRLS